MNDKTINNALRALPGNSNVNWMSVAPGVAKKLTKAELLKVLHHTVLRHGVTEHDAFYNALKYAVGEERGAVLIETSTTKPR